MAAVCHVRLCALSIGKEEAKFMRSLAIAWTVSRKISQRARVI